MTIPLTVQNILSLTLIVTLTIVGTVYIMVLISKKRCSCKLCTKEIVLEENLGEGGFGAIFKVKKATTGQEYILKKLEMRDLNELEAVQHEAK